MIRLIPFQSRLPVVTGFLVLWMGVCWCQSALGGFAEKHWNTSIPKSTGGKPLLVLNLEGESVDPFKVADSKAVVLLFVAPECPIANHYAPEIRRIASRFAASGARFWLVYPDREVPVQAIQEHLNAFQWSLPALRDPQHELVRMSRVKVTPEVAVFLPTRKLVYHGRIDDRFADFGKERPQATSHELENVIEAIVEGRPAPIAHVRAVGCYIPDPK